MNARTYRTEDHRQRRQKLSASESPPNQSGNHYIPTKGVSVLKTFEDAYQSELAKMVRLATYILSSNTRAEEVVQEAFIKLHGDWAEVDNPAGYLRTAVVNRCRDSLRRQKVKDRYVSLAAPVSQSSDVTYLLDVLEKLKPKRRLVVVLKFYGGYSLREIAEITGFPEGTVRSNLHRGLQQLEEELS